jgi:heme a synthase
MTGRLRRWQPSPRLVVTAAAASLVVHVLIVVTGGAVRLTGSGLGCPTWPPCTRGHFVTTREQGIHGLVENSNRALTGVLLVVAVLTILVMWRLRPRRRALLWLSLWLLVGIVVQAVLGGITVLTGLNPLMVMAHYLVSAGLIAVAVLLLERTLEGDGPPEPLVSRELRWLGRALVGVTAAVLLVGTVVTGSGPHSGDTDVTHRLPFELTTVAQLHADLVFLLFGLAVALAVALRATGAPRRTQRRVLELVAVGLLQGVVGYVQYFTKLPAGLVAVHVLGSTLVWVAALRIPLGMRVRRPLQAAGVDQPAAARAGGSRATAGTGRPSA